MGGYVDARDLIVTQYTSAVRERARKAVMAAVQEFESADADLAAHREREKAIRKRRDDARQALTTAMTGRSRVLVGTSLITCNEHGGVRIEHVDLLGDVA